jgi:hypothetical protein
MQVLPETRAVVADVHNAWFPHIVHDLHQMQATGPRYVVPPYTEPYEPNVDTLIRAQVNALGNEIAAALAAEGKSGVATSCIFDAFSPSRAYMHYHGGVRILSEAAGVRIASPIALRADQLIEMRGFDPRQARSNHPSPWQGGTWTLADIIDYNETAVWAVLRHAARYRDRWIRNFTTIQQRALDDNKSFAFLIPPFAAQREPTTAYELLRLLQAGGVEIEQAPEPVVTNEREMPKGTFVIRVAQPFGRFAKTLLEIRPYPRLMTNCGVLPYPYDITTHCLPLQMGVTCHETHEGFASKLEPADLSEPPAAKVLGCTEHSNAYVFSADANASARLANMVLESGATLSRLVRSTMIDGRTWAAGTFVISGLSADRLQRLTATTGVNAHGVQDGHNLESRGQTAPRLGLYRSWLPNAIDAGWTDHILREYGFSPITIRDHDIRQGNLNAHIDALVLAHETARQIVEGNSPGDYPTEYTGGIGEVGLDSLRQFVEHGGTLIALDGATELAIRALYLPVTNVLHAIDREAFCCPGSLVRILIDIDHPIGWGFEREAAGMFVSSPAFETHASDTASTSIVATYPLTPPLLAGWLHGEEHLRGHAAVVEVEVGQGRAILLGLRTQFRAQARGTYRLLFNSIFRAGLA